MIKCESVFVMRKIYGMIFTEQNAVTDTLAALVYDIDATAEVLRRGSMKKKRTSGEEVITGYNLRITPGPEEAIPIPSPKYDRAEDGLTLEEVSRDYGVDISDSQMSSTKKRARSETPRRMINIEVKKKKIIN
ncbi:unnamed protein product [Onchocerca flexuosa]|uniref:Movement protein n=1 Tax=Onchocerca flexuosa TaxID=387005 RepID=A0A183HLH1_9BILA|nr:unnamed protein product [Onchocerca flexuosa]